MMGAVQGLVVFAVCSEDHWMIKVKGKDLVFK